MTSEEAAFQAMLDANPDDWQTRLVFADWLADRGDVRSEGYRALAKLRKHPGHWKTEDGLVTSGAGRGFWFWLNPLEPKHATICLPDSKWWNRFRAKIGPKAVMRSARREIEDAAAITFALLPESRRAELLGLSPSHPASSCVPHCDASPKRRVRTDPMRSRYGCHA